MDEGRHPCGMPLAESRHLYRKSGSTRRDYSETKQIGLRLAEPHQMQPTCPVTLAVWQSVIERLAKSELHVLRAELVAAVGPRVPMLEAVDAELKSREASRPKRARPRPKPRQ